MCSKKKYIEPDQKLWTQCMELERIPKAFNTSYQGMLKLFISILNLGHARMFL